MANSKDIVAASKEKRRKREKGYLYIITRCYVLLVLAVYPLYVGPEGYNNIIFRKVQVFWTVSIAFLIIFMLFYLAYRLELEKENKPPAFWKTMTVPDWAAAGFLLMITVSCIISKYKPAVWLGQPNRYDGWLTYFCMIAAYFILSRWYNPKQLDFVIFAAGSALVCIVGFLQFYGYDFLKLFPYNAPLYSDANGAPLHSGFSIVFRTTLGNIDFLGTYACIAIVLFGALYAKTKGKLRFLYLAVSVMNFVMMIIGDVDAGKVGTLGAMVLLVPYWVSERKILGRALTLVSLWGLAYTAHHWFVINVFMPLLGEGSPAADLAKRDGYSTLPLNAVLIISVIALTAGIVLLIPKFTAWPKMKTARIAGFCLVAVMIFGGLAGVEVIGQRLPDGNMIYEAREMMHGRMQDDFGSRRGYIWRKTLEQVSARPPIFGTGSDTFAHAFGKLNQQEAREIHAVSYDKAHNDFLQILVCNGIIALISYLALIGSIVILSIKKSFDDTFLLMAAGAVLAYLVQSFFGIDTVTVTPIFWTMLAVMRRRQTENA